MSTPQFDLNRAPVVLHPILDNLFGENRWPPPVRDFLAEALLRFLKVLAGSLPNTLAEMLHYSVGGNTWLVMMDGGFLCPRCLKDEERLITEAILENIGEPIQHIGDPWYPIGYQEVLEDDYCGHCGMTALDYCSHDEDVVALRPTDT